jgi:hypothetical protein
MIRFWKMEFVALPGTEPDCIQRNSFAYYECKCRQHFFLGNEPPGRRSHWSAL